MTSSEGSHLIVADPLTSSSITFIFASIQEISNKMEDVVLDVSCDEIEDVGLDVSFTCLSGDYSLYMPTSERMVRKSVKKHVAIVPSKLKFVSRT